MKKRYLFSVLLLIPMIFALLTATAFAENTDSCGPDVYWSFDSEHAVLTITGTGTMYDFNSSIPVPWEDCLEQIQTVVIEDGVTTIGSIAFQDCSQLREVELPDSLTSIHSSAFYRCSALEQIELPSSLTSINSYAFSNCNSLRELIIPDGVSYISNSCFNGCTALEQVELPENAISLESSAFAGCTSLQSITIPDGVKSIQINCFVGCTALKQVHMPQQLIQLGEAVFRGCSSLQSISVPSGVTSISQQLFFDCSSLENASFSGEITAVNSQAFSKCSSLKTLDLHGPVTKIGSYAFSNCQQLSNFDLPDTVRTIGESAFYNCRALTNLTVPEGVTKIEANTFNYCISLESISLPSTLKEIGDSAFYYNIALTAIQLPASLESIGNSAFSLCYGLTEMNIPAGITRIPNALFYHCDHLTAVSLPDNLTEIGDRAFYECYLLESLEIPEGLEKIGKYSFYCCYKLNPELPDSLKSIDEGGFYWCCFQQINLPEGLESIGPYAFYRSQGLEEISIPASVRLIGQGAFDGCSSFVKCTVFSREAEIGVNALGTPRKTIVYGYAGSDAELAAVRDSFDFVDLESGQASLNTNNQNAQDYAGNWASVIRSYLYIAEDGTLTRVENSGSHVIVEGYSRDYQKQSSREIPMELPLFGGYYHGEGYHILVFGQTNSQDDDSVEVIRVVRYSEDWQRLDSVSMFGSNTSIPFNSGSLRMAESNGILYVHTSHQMYLHTDGKKHQANLTFCVRLSDMTITDKSVEISNILFGYVSHSFNQFIQIDGDQLYTVDHGDANPRSVVLLRYNQPAGEAQYNGTCSCVHVLPIANPAEKNATGVRVGGFEYSSSGFLIAGCSIPQDGSVGTDGQRNLFVG